MKILWKNIVEQGGTYMTIGRVRTACWTTKVTHSLTLLVAYPGILFGGGGQQIRLRIEDRENGDLGAVAP